MRLIRKFSFSQRVLNYWNALKQQAVDCNTVDSFKIFWIAVLKIGDFYKLMLLFPLWSHMPFGHFFLTGLLS